MSKMMSNKMDVRKVISHFGGPKKLADALEVSRQVVSGWKVRGRIPILNQLHIQKATRGKFMADTSDLPFDIEVTMDEGEKKYPFEWGGYADDGSAYVSMTSDGCHTGIILMSKGESVAHFTLSMKGAENLRSALYKIQGSYEEYKGEQQ